MGNKFRRWDETLESQLASYSGAMVILVAVAIIALLCTSLGGWLDQAVRQLGH